MTFEIAGVPVVVDGRWGPAQDLRTQYARYEATRTLSGEPVRVELGCAAPAARLDTALLFEKGDTLMNVDVEGRRVWICGDMRPFLVDRLLMHAMSCFLAVRSTLVLHAAAIEGPGGAIAFIGPSESGKTTAARNCPARLLHPDRAAIGVGEAGPWLAPLPFLYGEPRTGPVGGLTLDRLLLVEKSPRNAVRELSPRERMRAVCRAVLLPPETSLADCVLQTVQRLASMVRVDVLEARREGGFWPLLSPPTTVATQGETG